MARIAIDLSHNQRNWNGYFPSLQNQSRTMTAHTFETIEAPRTLDAATLANYDALILALPCNQVMPDDTINAVRAWVTENKKGLFLLSSYSGDAHHRTNLNDLARPLGVEFSEDLVMPHDRVTDDDGHNHVRDRGGTAMYIVRVSPPGAAIGMHPIAQNIKTLGFLSACSIKFLHAPIQFLLPSPNDSAILEPQEPIRNGRWIYYINWALAMHQSVPLLAAWQADFGKVVAIGAWKLWLPELLTTQNVDNEQLFKNVIEWLIS